MKIVGGRSICRGGAWAMTEDLMRQYLREHLKIKLETGFPDEAGTEITVILELDGDEISRDRVTIYRD
jgi:hypothetical protein